MGSILTRLDLRRRTSLGALVDGIFLELAFFGEGIGAALVFALAVASGTTASCTNGGWLGLANVTRLANLLDLGEGSWTFGAVVNGTSLNLDSSLALHRELGATNSVETCRAGAVILLVADVGSGLDDAAVLAFLFHLRLSSRAAALVQRVGIKATLRGE